MVDLQLHRLEHVFFALDVSVQCAQLDLVVTMNCVLLVLHVLNDLLEYKLARLLFLDSFFQLRVSVTEKFDLALELLGEDCVGTS